MTAAISKPELQRELRAHLQPGEAVLWSGQPQAGFFLRAGEIIATPFLILWGGGMMLVGGLTLWALLFEPERIAPGAEWFLPLLVPLVLLAGFYALVGRFIYDMSRRMGTLYVLTDRRVLILSGLRWRFCRSRTLSETSWIASRKHRSGRMTIWFGPRPLLYRLFSDSRPGEGIGLYFFEFLEAPRVAGVGSVRFGWFLFELIENGEAVYALAEEARRKARS